MGQHQESPYPTPTCAPGRNQCGEQQEDMRGPYTTHQEEEEKIAPRGGRVCWQRKGEHRYGVAKEGREGNEGLVGGRRGWWGLWGEEVDDRHRI